MKKLLLALLLAAGCAPRYERIDHFTWAQPHTDVVWLTIDGKLSRCHLGDHGPVCVEAKWLPALPDFQAYGTGLPAVGMPAKK